MRINKIKLTTEMMKRDINQLKLAERAGISRGTLSCIKNGKSCSDEIGIKIANALNVPIEQLLEN